MYFKNQGLSIALFSAMHLFLMVGCQNEKINQNEELPVYELSFNSLAKTWDEGMPLGNANLGALIWQKDGKLRFSLDRADLWDLRPMENLNFEEYDFDWVKKQWENDTYENVQNKYDVPYDNLPAPSKIPGAALEFDISSLGEVKSVKLVLKNASCEVNWKNGAVLKTFVHATEPIGWYRFENIPPHLKPSIIPPAYVSEEINGEESPVSGQDLRRLGYEQGKIEQTENTMTYNQKGWSGFQYQVYTKWQQSENALEGSWSISSRTSENEIDDTAEEIVNASFSNGMYASMKSHKSWWSSFWGKSNISVPDTILQNQWYMEMYKFGSAARKNAPPISLQSVWTADNGKLPPWKGDFHHDLNTQLSYWPAYSGNHLDLEAGFLNWLNEHKPFFKKYTKDFYGTNGLNVPGVTTLTGEPMGGWIQYSFGPTVSAWLGQHFYLHWRYSMDREFLKKEAYPWLKDVVVHFNELSIIGEDGKRKLPLSSSPEIHDNSRDAWFEEMTNFDLALIRWSYKHASELARELGYHKEAKQWTKTLNEWPEYAIDETGLMLSSNLSLEESHRHFSHIMAIHPLGLIDVSNGEKDRQIIANTIEHLDKIGTSQWTGYSYSWFGNLKARNLDGNGAAKALKDFATSFVLPNSFHVNGDQSGTGKSNFTYRPFTLEGNFAFAAGIQEMLIQSHTGIIKLFPALPDDWMNVGFSQLRAEGAFLVSSKKEEGVVKWVRIMSERGGQLRLENPFRTKDISTNDSYKYVWEKNILVIETKPKEIIILKPKALP
jgi:alpha-L-fucosidase 2